MLGSINITSAFVVVVLLPRLFVQTRFKKMAARKSEDTQTIVDILTNKHNFKLKELVMCLIISAEILGEMKMLACALRLGNALRRSMNSNST